MPVVGRDAARKAERQAQAVLERFEDMLRQRNLPPPRDRRIERWARKPHTAPRRAASR
jgi:hypothetical protein